MIRSASRSSVRNSEAVKDFGADRNRKSQKFYRIFNEVPTVLMILIVFVVVLKPF